MDVVTLRPATHRHTRRAALLCVTALVASLVAVGAAPAADATSYRFWSYWTGGSDWAFSSQGAARRPADGGVDGWRFATSPTTTSSVPPRHAPSFDSLCGKTSAQDGKKRVGLVVDFGVAADAPEGESPPGMIATCAVVPSDATGYDVLMTVATLRTDRGLICGLNGYPATECGSAVSDPGPSATVQPDDDTTSSGGDGDGGDGDGSAGGAAISDNGSSSGNAKSNQSGGKKNDTDDDRSGTKGDDEGSPTVGSTTTVDDTVAAAAAATPPTAPSSGSPIGLVVGLLVAAGLAAAAFVVRRRRA